jgi:hypothetical protein
MNLVARLQPCWHEVAEWSELKVVAKIVADMLLAKVVEHSRDIAARKDITKIPRKPVSIKQAVKDSRAYGLVMS